MIKSAIDTLTCVRFVSRSALELAGYINSKYGRTHKLSFFGQETIITKDKDIIIHIMRTNPKNYATRFGNHEGLKIIGMYDRGIIWNTVLEKWKQQRKIFQIGVRNEVLENANDIIIMHTQKEISNLKKKIRVSPSEPIVLLDNIKLMNFRNTLKLMFNVEEEFSADNSVENEIILSIGEYFKAWEYFLLKPKWAHYLYPRLTAKHKQAIKTVNDKMKIIISKALSDQALTDNFRYFFNELLKRNLSEAEISQNVLEMMLAGIDTSSYTLNYTLMAICEQKDLLAKLRREIYDVCGEGDPKSDDLMKLQYMECVLLESMRLKPVGPIILRRSLEEDKIKNLNVKPNTNFILNLVESNKEQEYYQNPGKFNPERFERNSTERGYFMPFGMGLKSCVGQFLAMREMKIILCGFLREFDFECDTKFSQLETRWDIANVPKKPIHFILRERQK